MQQVEDLQEGICLLFPSKPEKYYGGEIEELLIMWQNTVNSDEVSIYGMTDIMRKSLEKAG